MDALWASRSGRARPLGEPGGGRAMPESSPPGSPPVRMDGSASRPYLLRLFIEEFAEGDGIEGFTEADVGGGELFFGKVELNKSKIFGRGAVGD